MCRWALRQGSADKDIKYFYLQRSIEERQRTNVKPKSANNRKSHDFNNEKQCHFDYHIAESDDPSRLLQPADGGESVRDHEDHGDDAVAAQRRQHPLEVSAVDVVFQIESGDGEMADVIGGKSWKEKKSYELL